MNKRKAGTIREERAAEYLAAAGYRILAKNFRCRLGEIDIVAWDPGADPPCLVFVEVKYRKNSSAGYPEESLTAKKRQTIVRVAEFFYCRHKIRSCTPCRFDVVAVEGVQLRHYPDAFQADAVL